MSELTDLRQDVRRLFEKVEEVQVILQKVDSRCDPCQKVIERVRLFVDGNGEPGAKNRIASLEQSRDTGRAGLSWAKVLLAAVVGACAWPIVQLLITGSLKS